MITTLSTLDWVVIGTYLLFLILFALWLSHSQDSREDYYVGGRHLELVSVYSYLERRFDLKTRLVLSALFLFVRAFATAVTVYSIAIVIDLITGSGFFLAVVLLGVFTVIYDVLGAFACHLQRRRPAGDPGAGSAELCPRRRSPAGVARQRRYPGAQYERLAGAGVQAGLAPAQPVAGAMVCADAGRAFDNF